MEKHKDQSRETVVRIENLKKHFQGNQVLQNVNLTIPKGENAVVIGQSGIGKSVLIKCLVRLIVPDGGSIKIFGQEVTRLDEDGLNSIRKRIGFLFQGNALYDSMTVRENLEFPLQRNKLVGTKKEMDAHVYEALDNVGLRKTVDLLPSELSGGMKKRIGLARTLILNPEIIMYDEPTTGLDPITSKEISNLIVKIQEKYHTTAIIITHDISCVKLTSNIIHVLKDGEIYQSGKFDKLKTSDDRWIYNFFN